MSSRSGASDSGSRSGASDSGSQAGTDTGGETQAGAGTGAGTDSVSGGERDGGVTSDSGGASAATGTDDDDMEDGSEYSGSDLTDSDETVTESEGEDDDAAAPKKIVEALYAFRGPGEDDLSFSPGDLFALLHQDGDNAEWWFAHPKDEPAREGFIPANYFRFVQVQQQRRGERQRSTCANVHGTDHLPPAPRPAICRCTPGTLTRWRAVAQRRAPGGGGGTVARWRGGAVARWGGHCRWST